MATKYLIRNATVVSMDAEIGVQNNYDVLIDGSLIKAVGPNLPDAPGAVIIDGTDAIVSPGFIDTHRHVWQTQLANLLSNETLVRTGALHDCAARTDHLMRNSLNTSSTFAVFTAAATHLTTHICK